MNPATQQPLVTFVVFSKDRPLQLHAALASARATCQDAERVRFAVMVYASTDAMAARYVQVARELPWAELVAEDGFKATLLSLSAGAEHLGFLVDDSVFVRPWRAAEAVGLLAQVPKALGVSLRLGRNTTRCYTRSAPQAVPPLLELPGGWLACDWTEAEHDFGYPLELSSSIYRARDVRPFLESSTYLNPNQLEDQLSQVAEGFRGSHPALLLPPLSAAFSVPLNVVQATHANRNKGDAAHEAEALGARFDAGARVDVAALRGFVPSGCHEELELPLRGGAPGAAPGPARPPATEPAAPSEVEREEFDHLAVLLQGAAPGERRAVDVGANVGEVTLHLARQGFSVLALEPNPAIASRVVERLGAERLAERCQVLPVAASDAEGHAELIVGSAHTVATLDPRWTEVAFPECFQQPQRLRVRTRPLLHVLREQGFTGAAFVKVDVEGHEPSVLQGLLDGARPEELPACIMFEANQRFPERARRCLALLAAAGYGTVDVFIKDRGLLGATRFSGPELPELWARCDRPGVYFYANFIAYLPGRIPPGRMPARPGAAAAPASPAAPAPCAPPPPTATPTAVFERARALELARPFPVHQEWEAMRQELRTFVARGELSQFLRHPICRRNFVREGFGPGQRHELETLLADPVGRQLLGRALDPAVGGPASDLPVAGVSANTLGMTYYLWRLRRSFPAGLPAAVVEIGGGYGSLARLYLQEAPASGYVIVDLPEMLALQQHFLERTLPPGCRVRFHDAGPVRPRPGEITLVPASLTLEAGSAELFLSTFAFSEMPREAQRLVEGHDYFGARHVFLAGQLATELPDLHWVKHAEVVGPLMQRFRQLAIERFHIGDNYLLEARR